MTDSPPCTDEALSRVRARVERLERVIEVLLYETKMAVNWAQCDLYDDPPPKDEEGKG
jgi:hypothetical protein